MTIRFTSWRNCGLGIMLCPPLKQAGLIFLIWSIVFIWGTDGGGPNDGLTEPVPLKIVA